MTNLPEAHPPVRKKLAAIAPLLGVLLFCTVLLLPWWRSYLGVTNDGWHLFGALRILGGEVPYRDYYLFIPPFHQLKIAAVIAVFGRYLIAAQAVGLVERLILAAVVYAWLRRAYSPVQSLAGSVFGMVLYFMASTETLSSLQHEAGFWPVLAGFAASCALRSSRSAAWLAVSGVFSGIAFFSKQTSGVAVGGAVVLIVAAWAWRERGPKEALRAVSCFAAGWLLPAVLVLGWLLRAGALPAFVDQVFISGPSSKGSPAAILVRPFSMLLEDTYQTRYTVLSIAAVFVLGVLWLWKRRAGETPRNLAGPAILTGLALAAIGSGALLSRQTGIAAHPFFERMPEAVAFRCALWISGILFAVYFVRFFRTRLDQRGHQMLLISGVSISIALVTSMSWALPRSMAVTCCALLAAFAWSLEPAGKLGRLWTIALSGALFASIAQLTWTKFDKPYEWSGWREPNIREARHSSTLPELAGLRLSAPTIRFVEDVTRTIAQNSSPQDRIFVYPHMPIFYFLAHRRPAVFAPVHFIDVCPDHVAREDAARIRSTPPAVIVYFHHTEAEILSAERTFRGGRRSGQRDLTAAIEALEPGYRLALATETPLTRHRVEVWVRMQPAVNASISARSPSVAAARGSAARSYPR